MWTDFQNSFTAIFVYYPLTSLRIWLQVFRSTLSVDCSQCRTRLRDWRIICVDPTTSPTRSSASTCCACRSESSTRLPFWSTKSCTDLRRNTLVHSTTSPTYLGADLLVLLTPTVWQCLQSSWQPSPTRLSRMSVHGLGTTCRTTWRLPASVND